MPNLDWFSAWSRHRKAATQPGSFSVVCIFLHNHIRALVFFQIRKSVKFMHTANTVQAWLISKFKKSLSTRKCGWSSSSADLNPWNYFVWGHLKMTAYNPLSNTINELKANIEQDCNKLTSDILKPFFF